MKKLIIALVIFLAACAPQLAAVDVWGGILAGAQPGDTIWLSAGTYPQFDCGGIAGTSQSPIIIRAKPAERVTIDGHAWLSACPYVWLWGVEISGNQIDDGYHPGEGTKLINSVVHGFSQGSASGSSVHNYTIYGSLFYGNGIDSIYSHGLYNQHFKELINGDGWALFKHNVAFDNSGNGFQIYGSKTIQNVKMFQNISFDTGRRYEYVIGGTLGLENLVFDRNISVHSEGVNDYYSTRIGMYGTWSNVTFTNNYLAGVRPLYLLYSPTVYYGNTVYYTTRPPDRTWVWPNEYDDRFALVTVVNSSNKATVTVDLPFSGDVWMCNVRTLDNCQDIDVYDGKAQIIVSGLPFAVFRAEKKYFPMVYNRLYLPIILNER